MNKEFIPYEQALELKELGFNESCMFPYHRNNTEYIDISHIELANYNATEKLVSAVLYQQAFRWFREKHGWVGGVRNLDRKKPMIVADFVKDEDNLFMIWADNYEDAELKALKELIERINSKI